MDIKSFKDGVAQLTAYTNQRQADPNPFALQFARDGRVSLIAADERATLVWDIGFSDHFPGRVGVSSKVLYQAAKVLKGKGNIAFSFGEDDLFVEVEGGGKITLPHVEAPVFYHKPDKQYDVWIDDLDFPAFVKKIGAVEPTRYNYVVCTPVSSDQTTTVRINASNGYIVYETVSRPTNEIAEPVAWRIDAFTSMKSPKNSVIALGEKSIRVDSEDFHLYTRLLRQDEFIHYPSLKDHHYPEGTRPQVAIKCDRKALAAAIKGVAPDAKKDKDQQFRLIRDENAVTIEGIQFKNSMTVATKSGFGHGTITLGAIYTLPVLDALDTDDILIVYGHPKIPVGFRGKDSWESYLVAPVTFI